MFGSRGQAAGKDLMKRLLRICFFVLLILGALMKYGVAQEVLAVSDETVAGTMHATCHNNHCTGTIGLPAYSKLRSFKIVRQGEQFSVTCTLDIKPDGKEERRISRQEIYQPRDEETNELIPSQRVDKVCFLAWGGRKPFHCMEVK